MKRPAPLAGLWQSDKGLSAMLVFLCLALFVGSPLADTGRAGEFAFDILFSMILVSGVVIVGKRPVLTWLVAALTAATLALRWAGFQSPGSLSQLAGFALSIALFSILATLVLVQVFREGPITVYRIQGAVVVYLLAGFAWAAAYEVVYRALPGAFQFAQHVAGEGRISHGLLYYSFVTLTTLGFGDLSPAVGLPQALVALEALLGQVFLVTLVARLVSMYGTRQRPARDGPDDPDDSDPEE